MSDLISRQAAIDAIVNTVSEIWNHDSSEVARYGATFRQHEILDIIESLPSVQPEIIRCKDCKYAYMTGDGLVKYCDIWFPEDALYQDGDYFCADGERGDSDD